MESCRDAAAGDVDFEIIGRALKFPLRVLQLQFRPHYCSTFRL
jgi:hypothetical protein